MTTETTEPKQLRRSTRVAAKRDAEEPAAPVEVKKPAAKKAKTAKPDTKPAEDSSDAGEESNLSVGDSLPEGIVLKDHDGNDVDVSEVVKTGTVVIFAYPKASTPGCTKQVCGFRDNFPKFESAGVKVFGLSADTVNAQKNFYTKQKLTYQLLSDPEFKLIQPLGAKKTAKGGIIRSHWIFKDGKLKEAAIQISPVDSFTNALRDVQSEQGEPKKEEGEKEEKEEEETASADKVPAAEEAKPAEAVVAKAESDSEPSSSKDGAADVKGESETDSKAEENKE